MSDLESYGELDAKEVHDLVENKDIEGLVNVLKYHKHGYCLKLAIWPLGGWGVEEAIDPLLMVASTCQASMSVRQAAVRALGEIGNLKVVEPLLFLMGKHDYLREVVADALGRLKDQKAVLPLNMLMNDKDADQNVRQAALEALCKIGTQQAITNVVAVLNSDLCEQASAALKELGQAAVQPLISALNSKYETKAVGILGEIGNKIVADNLLGIIENRISAGNCEGLREIVRALVQIGEGAVITKAVEILIKAMKPNPLHTDNDYCFQCYLIFALGETQDTGVIKPLIRLLFHSTEIRIRYTAAYALATLGTKIHDPDDIKQLIGVLEDSREHYCVDNFIAFALLQTDENQVAVPLLKYLKSGYMELFKEKLFPCPNYD